MLPGSYGRDKWGVILAGLGQCSVRDTRVATTPEDRCNDRDTQVLRCQTESGQFVVF